MEDWLQKIVDDDDLGLLDVKPKNARITADERLVKSFEEINKFIEENKREPEPVSYTHLTLPTILRV